ncbi:hypothetical protein [Pseudochrobactrum sp. HB0163]|uniref:hypothetical protein n=1 Tax=Pseudochrobactrum sp. HB0163 TaxID=3450708 RepID=UPI003F6DF10A
MKALLSQPWRKIADLAGGRGVQAEWQNFPAELLTLTRDEATAIPCNGRSGCYMNVVKHSPSDIVGICTSEIKQCDRRTLTKTDIAIYRLNHQQLAKKIAEAIAFTEQLEQISGQGPLWKLGTLNPQAEHHFTVYCFLGQTSSQLEKVMNQLCMSNQTPFLLLASFSGLISAACSDASNRHKSKVLGIDDILSVDDAGAVQAKENAQTVVQSWLDEVLPKSAKPSESHTIILPSGTTWENITITFLTRDIISIKCGSETAVNYERLHIPGMFVASQREKKPSDRWYLLMAFALWGPTLNRENLRTLYRHDDWNRMRTQKSSLSKSLKQFFGLDEEPIPYDKKSYEYQPILTIRQDTNCDLNDWIADIHD